MAKIADTIDKGISYAEKGDYPRALETFKGLYQNYPDNPDVLYNYGRLLNDLHDFGEARTVLEQLVSLAPEYKNAKVALAFTYIHLKRTDKAKMLLEETRATDPGNTFLLRNLGSIYANEGMLELALEAFQEAEGAEPESRQILYGIALVLIKLERSGEASVYLERIIDQGVDDELDGLAKDRQREIAGKEFAEGGSQMAAVFYCLGALEAYEEMSFGQIQSTTFEIATLGRQGLDPLDPAREYRLSSIPGEFSALQLICFMYVGFKLLRPEIDIGFDFSQEYEAAKTMFQARHMQGHGS